MTAAAATGPAAGPLAAAAVAHLGGPEAIVVTSSTPLWYITRATGVVALVLLTTGMALGLLTAVRFEGGQWPRFKTGCTGGLSVPLRPCWPTASSAAGCR